MATPFLSVIIPAFNEEARIISTLDKLALYLGGQSFTWDVVVVDDGSSDRTASLVNTWSRNHRGFRLESIKHGGKGRAVKHGMLASRGKYRFMCDADLSMPIEQLGKFLEYIKDGHDIIIGSRQIAGAHRFNEPATRHVMGRLFNGCVRFIAVGAFQDTQCGFKCFRGEVADDLFTLQKTRGFGFDVEILYLASRLGLNVVEIPIDWYYQRSSKVRPGVDWLLMLIDAISVRWRGFIGSYGGYPTPSDSHTMINESGEATRHIESPEHQHRKDGLVAIVIPTYNEALNLPSLFKRVFALDIPNTRLVIVDDGSPDGTARVTRNIAAKFDANLELVQRRGKHGLGTAYVDGFSRALEDKADYVIQMDADLSHAPEDIPALLDALRGADVVVGSRYVRGGGFAEGWNHKRHVFSYFANAGIRMITGLKVRDTTSGFKAFHSGVLSSLRLEDFRCKGFGFQIEVAHACQQLGYRVIEHPIVFTDRTSGKSKMSFSIMLEAILHLVPLRWRQYKQDKQIAREKY